MTTDFTQLWKNILGARLVIPALALIAVGLAAYYAYLGFSYWSAQNSITALNAKIPSYRQTDTTYVKDLERNLADQQEQRERSNRIFDYSDADLLTFLARDALLKAQVDIRSVAVGEIENKVVDTLSFEVRPVIITLRGRLSQIDLAIRNLNQELSVGAVKRITLTDLDRIPTARIDFVFYLSPDVSEDEGDKQS